MMNKRVLIVVPIVVFLVLYFGIMMASANSSVPTEDCIVPPNNIGIAQYEKKGETYQVAITNIYDPNMGWIVTVQSFDGQYHEKTSFNPGEMFKEPTQLAGLVVRIEHEQTFNILYPKNGVCQVQEIY
jgi:hypothetical protein